METTEQKTALPFELSFEREGQSYYNILRDGKAWMGSVERTLAIEIVKKLNALTKIDDIRNSIVGYQAINWSAHIYPLVAALEEAGIHGMGYEKASQMAKDQLARIKELEERIAELEAKRQPTVEPQDWIWRDVDKVFSCKWSYGMPDDVMKELLSRFTITRKPVESK